jgi:hypothetical protein
LAKQATTDFVKIAYEKLASTREALALNDKPFVLQFAVSSNVAACYGAEQLKTILGYHLLTEGGTTKQLHSFQDEIGVSSDGKGREVARNTVQSCSVVFMWNRRAVRRACVRNLVQLCQQNAMQAVFDTTIVLFDFFAENGLQLHVVKDAEPCPVTINFKLIVEGAQLYESVKPLIPNKPPKKGTPLRDHRPVSFALTKEVHPLSGGDLVYVGLLDVVWDDVARGMEGLGYECSRTETYDHCSGSARRAAVVRVGGS